MRKATVNRPQKALPFTKGKIMIDGVECETVKAGKSATFEVPDGNHLLQVVFGSVPPTNSNPVEIGASDADANFEVKITVPLRSTDPTTATLTKK